MGTEELTLEMPWTTAVPLYVEVIANGTPLGRREAREDLMKLARMGEAYRKLAKPRFVIVTRDDEEGLLFWNNEHGFASLETATTFSEEEAKNYDLPIAADQPEWLQLPSPVTSTGSD